MFYQDALCKFLSSLSRVDSLGTIGDRTGESWPLVFKKLNQQIYFHLYLSMWVAYFCMGGCKHNGVVAIKMSNINGVLVFYGCLTSQFYSIH